MSARAEWIPEARKLYESDPKKYSYAVLAKMYNTTPGYIGNAFNRLKKRKDYVPTEPKVKAGKPERKPQIEDKGDYYIIVCEQTGQKVEITKEKLKQLKKLYCINQLTIPAICREINIPRPDFYLVKTAFGITHDDTPYLDSELMERSAEELAEETLEEKKRNYFLKLHEKEVQLLRQEVEKYREKDYFINKIQALVAEHFQNYPVGPAEIELKPCCSGKMLEISIVDLHLGKLAWAPETGENYDHKIAEVRFKEVIADVLVKVRDKQFEKILLIFGNDFFNFDTIDGTTTSGTRQDNDVRWQKLFLKGVDMLIWAIDILRQYAPVECILVPGNHDTMLSFFAANNVKAWFRNIENVTVNADPKTRKYIRFGNSLIGFTHGDKEKKRIFGCMQIEARQDWGQTLYHEWHGAHLHSEWVKEDLGVIVRNLSSVTGLDAWHYQSGYVGAIAKSQSFIWDREKGLEAILLTTIER